jgi:hypothetical protein
MEASLNDINIDENKFPRDTAVTRSKKTLENTSLQQIIQDSKNQTTKERKKEQPSTPARKHIGIAPKSESDTEITPPDKSTKSPKQRSPRRSIQTYLENTSKSIEIGKAIQLTTESDTNTETEDQTKRQYKSIDTPPKSSESEGSTTNLTEFKNTTKESYETILGNNQQQQTAIDLDNTNQAGCHWQQTATIKRKEQLIQTQQNNQKQTGEEQFDSEQATKQDEQQTEILQRKDQLDAYTTEQINTKIDGQPIGKELNYTQLEGHQQESAKDNEKQQSFEDNEHNTDNNTEEHEQIQLYQQRGRSQRKESDDKLSQTKKGSDNDTTNKYSLNPEWIQQLQRTKEHSLESLTDNEELRDWQQQWQQQQLEEDQQNKQKEQERQHTPQRNTIINKEILRSTEYLDLADQQNKTQKTTKHILLNSTIETESNKFLKEYLERDREAIRRHSDDFLQTTPTVHQLLLNTTLNTTYIQPRRELEESSNEELGNLQLSTYSSSEREISSESESTTLDKIKTHKIRRNIRKHKNNERRESQQVDTSSSEQAEQENNNTKDEPVRQVDIKSGIADKSGEGRQINQEGTAEESQTSQEEENEENKTSQEDSVEEHDKEEAVEVNNTNSDQEHINEREPIQHLYPQVEIVQQPTSGVQIVEQTIQNTSKEPRTSKDGETHPGEFSTVQLSDTEEQNHEIRNRRLNPTANQRQQLVRHNNTTHKEIITQHTDTVNNKPPNHNQSTRHVYSNEVVITEIDTDDDEMDSNPHIFNGHRLENAEKHVQKMALLLATKRLPNPSSERSQRPGDDRNMAMIGHFANSLKSDALMWFETLTISAERGNGSIGTYEALIEAFKRKFQFNETEQWRELGQLSRMTQAQLQTTEDYVRNVRQHGQKVRATDDQIKTSILNGLRPEIQAIVMNHDIKDFEDIKKWGLVAENYATPAAKNTNNIDALQRTVQDLCERLEKTQLRSLEERPRSRSVTFDTRDPPTRERSLSPINHITPGTIQTRTTRDTAPRTILTTARNESPGPSQREQRPTDGPGSFTENMTQFNQYNTPDYKGESQRRGMQPSRGFFNPNRGNQNGWRSRQTNNFGASDNNWQPQSRWPQQQPHYQQQQPHYQQQQPQQQQSAQSTDWHSPPSSWNQQPQSPWNNPQPQPEYQPQQSNWNITPTPTTSMVPWQPPTENLNLPAYNQPIPVTQQNKPMFNQGQGTWYNSSRGYSTYRGRGGPQPNSSRPWFSNATTGGESGCRNCNSPVRCEPSSCFATGKTCNRCGRMNHIASKCRSAPSN